MDDELDGRMGGEMDGWMDVCVVREMGGINCKDG